jgi:hypothetical protein
MADEVRTSPRLHAVRPVARARKGALPLLFLAAAAAWLVAGERATPPLHASTSGRATPSDLDGDGLADALERRIGTAPDQVDSDFDGYSDAEELARGSLPNAQDSIPDASPLGLALEAYQQGGPLQLTSVIYAQDGDFSTKSVSMGVRVGAFVRQLPLTFFTNQAVISTLPGAEAGSQVMVIDAALDARLVQRFGSLSFFTTLSSAGKIAGADVVNVFWKDGIVLEYIVEPFTPLPGPVRPAQSSAGLGRYEPIDPEAVPPDWTPDQICTQTMMVSASIGPVIVQEVVEAGCESGWDAYCDPACPATVGTTIETLDPGALIGG